MCPGILPNKPKDLNENLKKLYNPCLARTGWYHMMLEVVPICNDVKAENIYNFLFVFS